MGIPSTQIGPPTKGGATGLLVEVTYVVKDAGTLIVTGPTRTNVNDYRAILIP